MGTIRLAPPRAGWHFLVFAFVSMTAVAAVLVFGHYTRREPVSGTLVSSKGLISIVSQAPGRVVRVLAHEGDEVASGQALFALTAEKNSSSSGPLQAQIVEQLHASETTLASDRRAQSKVFDEKERSLTSELETLTGQNAQIESQIAVQTERSNSAKALYERWEVASNTGVVPKLQLLEQKDRLLDSQSQVHELQRQRLQNDRQVGQVRTQLKQLPAEREIALADIDRRTSEIRASLAQAEAAREWIITAPAAGRVVTVTTTSGQVVSERDALMHLVPKDSVLQAELWVPSRAIGFVGVGDEVSLRYSAFPFEKYGQFRGRVGSVSGSTIAPDSAAGLKPGEWYYRVAVELAGQNVEVGGQQFALKPGMSVDADVAQDRRRLIEILLEPFAKSVKAFTPAAGGNRT